MSEEENSPSAAKKNRRKRRSKPTTVIPELISDATEKVEPSLLLELEANSTPVKSVSPPKLCQPEPVLAGKADIPPAAISASNSVALDCVSEIITRKFRTTASKDGYTFLSDTFNTFVKQVDSAQDFVTFGENVRLKWIVLADGHGKSSVIDCIRGIKWDEIIEAKDINAIIYSAIEALGNTATDGATLTIVKIYPEYIDFYWAGDSEAKMFRNKAEVFRTKSHDAQNIEELTRVTELVANVSSEQCGHLRVVDNHTITQERTKNRYFTFTGYYFDSLKQDNVRASATMNMTHSFGHNGMSGNFMSYERVPFCKEVDGSETVYKVVVGSDGFWDMICETDHDLVADRSSNAYDLGSFAIFRWNRKWEYVLIKDKFDKVVQIHNDLAVGKGDDVSIGVWVGCI